ncbi:MAG: hypothetical protein ACK4UJ_09225 [Leptonema sp. (in: bacteria)]
MMVSYKVSYQEGDATFVYLRVMVYSPYINYLKQIRKGYTSNSEMFLKLTEKFIHRINSLTTLKNSSKKKYQQVTCNYQNIGIRVTQAVHQILKDFSDVTGYSISALVRFLIEWEYFNRQPSERHFDVVLNGASDNSSMITITEIEINHKYSILNERVDEILRLEFT